MPWLRVTCFTREGDSHPNTLKFVLRTPDCSGNCRGSGSRAPTFQRERAFDRQLDWYERMIRALHDMALRIDIAVTLKDDPITSREVLAEVWQKVQTCHIELEKLVSEAPLYASTEAANRSDRISGDVQKVADGTEAFDPVNHRLTDEQMELIVGLTEKLRRAAKPLAVEARRHLGMK